MGAIVGTWTLHMCFEGMHKINAFPEFWTWFVQDFIYDWFHTLT